jgi:IS5 family transposase
VRTDDEDGYINQAKVTPANCSEVCELDSMICEDKPRRVYADKGYASLENRQLLKGRKIRDGIMEKGVRNKALSYWQRLKNRLISKRRFIVEQSFGTLKRRFNFQRATYIRREKVEAQFILKAICFNLLKAINKAELILS